MISKYKELFAEVLNHSVCGIYPYYVDKVCQPAANIVAVSFKNTDGWTHYNIYELVHLNLKQCAKLKNVFDMIDWSGEPEEIFTKAEAINGNIR